MLNEWSKLCEMREQPETWILQIANDIDDEGAARVCQCNACRVIMSVI